MQHYLRGRGLLKFVDGSYPCPQFQIADDGTLSHDNTEAYEKWLEQDSFVISLITTTLSADALTLVVGCGTSMEVWLTLKQRYATVSDFHIMQLKSSLQSIQKGSDSIEKHLLIFKSVRDQLAVLGVRISDQDVKALILVGLPNVYGHTRQIIRSKNNIDLEDVSYFSSPTPSSEFAPQTGGFLNQNGGLKVQNVDYTSASQFNCSQQGFSPNNGVYSNMPQQQGSLSQTTSNSCFNGGYT
ncbi:hypothetical protein ACLB2K_036724 [Fragaria x ananassa]